MLPEGPRGSRLLATQPNPDAPLTTRQLVVIALGLLMAISAAATAFLMGLVPTPPTVPTNPTPVTGVLASKNLSLTGYLKCPADTDQNSTGKTPWLQNGLGLICRKLPDGSKRLLMVGFPPSNFTPVAGYTANDGNAIVEISIAGFDPVTPPRASLLNVYHVATIPPNNPNISGVVTPGAPAMAPDGTIWLPWAGFYNVTSSDYPCLSSYVPGGASGGPWFVQAGAKAVRGYTFFGPDGKFYCGSPLVAGNASSSWGPSVIGVTLDPSVPVAPDLTSAATATSPKLPSQQLSFYPIGNKLTRDAYQSVSGTTLFKNQTTWTESDFVYCAAWVKTPTLEGILFAGNVAAPGSTIWYGNGTADPATVTLFPPSGLVDPIAPNTRGDHATAYVPRCWIYSAADLTSVSSGAKLPYQISPVETFDPAAMLGLPLGQGGSIVGMCQDPDDPGLVYLNCGSIERVSPFSSICQIAAVRVQ